MLYIDFMHYCGNHLRAKPPIRQYRTHDLGRCVELHNWPTSCSVERPSISRKFVKIDSPINLLIFYLTDREFEDGQNTERQSPDSKVYMHVVFSNQQYTYLYTFNIDILVYSISDVSICSNYMIVLRCVGIIYLHIPFSSNQCSQKK